jgi:hypothetical protein
MYADHLVIYRFDAARDGEVADRRRASLQAARGGVAQIPNAPAGGDWMWRDANGDGKFDSNEFTPNTSGTRNW